MKAIKVLKPGELVISEVEMPKIEKDDDVLIRVKAAGICGSDVSIFKGTSPVATYPRVIGHEFAGEVVEIGKNVKNVAVGDHVTVNPVNGCGVCRVCESGRSNVCATLNVFGVHVDGGYREYVVIPAKNAFVVPKDMPWRKAAMVEPYSVAAQVTSRGGVKAGDKVLILGSGQIALMILQACKILGAFCIVTDIVASRLSLAEGFGADVTVNTANDDIYAKVKELTGVGVDISIDAACVGITLEQAIKCTRPAGVIVTMGFSEKAIPTTELTVTKNELEIRGSRLNNNKFPQVIEWFVQGKVDPEKMISDSYHFTDVMKGFDKIKEHPESTMKVALTF